tara:strand:- start:8652 stop:8924 length:273 start_codon:yes stop_codon:yes gene_type:complete
MKNETENRACALEFNNVIYELQSKGHSDNAIANGILFALSIHIINSRFSLNEIIEQLTKLFHNIKTELGKLDDDDQIDIEESKPVNSQWD